MYSASLGGVVAFAAAVTLVCTSWALSSGKGAVALNAREAKLAMAKMDRDTSERVFVTHSLGLVQGWAWVDVVDGGINALLQTRPLRTLSRALPRGVSDLLVTLVITLLVNLGLIHGIRWLTRELARGNWKVAKRRSLTKRHILSMAAALGNKPPLESLTAPQHASSISRNEGSDKGTALPFGQPAASSIALL